jgi:hypothetical protein
MKDYLAGGEGKGLSRIRANIILIASPILPSSFGSTTDRFHKPSSL